MFWLVILLLLISFVSFSLGGAVCLSAINKLSPEAYTIIEAKLKKEDE